MEPIDIPSARKEMPRLGKKKDDFQKIEVKRLINRREYEAMVRGRAVVSR
jgi:hypothetical protein